MNINSSYLYLIFIDIDEVKVTSWIDFELYCVPSAGDPRYWIPIRVQQWIFPFWEANFVAPFLLVHILDINYNHAIIFSRMNQTENWTYMKIFIFLPKWIFVQFVKVIGIVILLLFLVLHDFCSLITMLISIFWDTFAYLTKLPQYW